MAKVKFVQIHPKITAAAPSPSTATVSLHLVNATHINDADESSKSAWSSSKIVSWLNSKLEPITSSLAKRLRFDAPQDLTSAEKANARSSLGLGELATQDTIQDATIAQKGVVQLDDAYADSEALAATARSVKRVKTTADAAIAATEKGAANGVAPLDADSKIPSQHLPSYADAALKLNTARTINLSGDAAGSVNFDGSQDVTLNATLATVPVAKGGTGATEAAAARTNLGLGTAATKDVGVAGGLAALDANSKVLMQSLPDELYTWHVIDLSSLDDDTSYPVYISIPDTKTIGIKVFCSFDDNSGQVEWSTHIWDTFYLYAEWSVNGSSWGEAGIVRNIDKISFSWVNTCPLTDIGQQFRKSNEFFYLRGGAKYNIAVTDGLTPQLVTTTLDDGNGDIQQPKPYSNANIPISHVHNHDTWTPLVGSSVRAGQSGFAAAWRKLTSPVLPAGASSITIAHGVTKPYNISARCIASDGKQIGDNDPRADYKFSCYLDGANIVLSKDAAAIQLDNQKVTIYVYEDLS